MDVQAYLNRIGAPAPEHTVPALRALVRAHLEQIPFENLDILAGRGPLSLGEEDLMDKVVARRRGGYCFELNGLFCLLLRELGFRVYSPCARILYRRDDPRPWSHRVNVVELEGGQWLCDVGYGGPGPKGVVCLSQEGPQAVEGETFSVERREGLVTLLRHDPDGVHPMIVYRDEPCHEVDFEVMNGYFSAHPRSVFTQKYIIYRCTPEGQVSLVADTFTRQRQGKTVETRTVTDPAARRALLGEVFGLTGWE